MNDSTTNAPTDPTASPKLAMIAAGGTGGHIFPGLAIADRLIEVGWTMRWVGARDGMEAALVTRRGMAFDAIPIVGLRGKGILRYILLPWIVLRAMALSIGLLRKHKPDMLIAMGGYVAFAPAMAAALLGVPVMIHEQNAVSGWVNRVLSAIADLRFSAFPDALKSAQTVGNPVQRAMLNAELPEIRFAAREGPLKLLIVGGSRGAHWINEVLPAALAAIDIEKRPQILHQSGARADDRLRQTYERLGVEATVVDFIHDMASAYAEADLVVCRAGAMTVFELASVGVGSIMIPFPHAVDDHQCANARYLLDHGAAYLIRQSEVTIEALSDLLASLTRETCLDLALKARALSPGDAAAVIVADCIDFVERKTS